MRVKLSSLPDPKSLSCATYSGFRGGLNLQDDPVQVGTTQSPDILNMWYKDGVLKKRSGQRRIAQGATPDRQPGNVWFYSKLFNGLMVFVDGTSIKYFDPRQDPAPTIHEVPGTKIAEGSGHGTFFAFDERLYYKADGTYLRLSYENGALVAENILWKDSDGYGTGPCVYTPIIAINRNADGSGGTTYQPENRINARKVVWFDIDESSRSYYLPVSSCTVEAVQLGDTVVDTSAGAWPYTIEGRDVWLRNGELSSDSVENSYLEFSAPLYIDFSEDGAWNGGNYQDEASSVTIRASDIVCSTFDWVVGNNTLISTSKLLVRGNGLSGEPGEGLPPMHKQRIADYAQTLTPFAPGEVFPLILDNGKAMDILFFPYDLGLDDKPYPHVKSYDTDTTRLVARDYYHVRYDYGTQSFTKKNCLNVDGTDAFYLRHIAYSGESFVIATPSAEVSGVAETQASTAVATVAVLSGKNRDNQNSLYDTSLLQIATSNRGDHAVQLLFAESRETEWRYVFSSTQTPAWEYDNQFTDGMDNLRVKSIDTAQDGTGICLENVVVVTLPKDNPLLGVTSGVHHTSYRAPVSGIFWSACNIVHQACAVGDVLVKASSTAEHEKLASIATFRAKRDFPELATTGHYAVVKTVDGDTERLQFVMDTGLSVHSYDQESTDMEISGVVVEAYTEKGAGTTALPDLSTPATMSNKLRVTYRKENPDAFRAIADCIYTASFGGSDAVCVVFGGCKAQPNAIFWSGNGSSGIDPTYFPMDQFNLCGSYQDPVTGFGKQQSSLIVLQTAHTSKASYGIETIGERKYIDLKLSTINTERGCDMPWSIALCGNNLTWMHSKYGVLYLKATTSAYENMIVVISENINGTAQRPGLLSKIRDCNPYQCVGMEDGSRYYAFVDGDLYVWDFTIYAVADGIGLLSWSKHQHFSVQGAAEADTGSVYMLDGDGGISVIDENETTDFGEPIPFRYYTPMEAFGGYYKMRNIERIVVGLKADATSSIEAHYIGEGHNETQRVITHASQMYEPLVLKPRGLRVHHFQFGLECAGSEGDIELSSVAFYYTNAGRTT